MCSRNNDWMAGGGGGEKAMYGTACSHVTPEFLSLYHTGMLQPPLHLYPWNAELNHFSCFDFNTLKPLTPRRWKCCRENKLELGIIVRHLWGHKLFCSSLPSISTCSDLGLSGCLFWFMTVVILTPQSSIRKNNNLSQLHKWRCNLLPDGRYSNPNECTWSSFRKAEHTGQMFVKKRKGENWIQPVAPPE